MNRQLVELVVQTVLAMSDEERRLLDDKLRLADVSSQHDDFADLDESLLIAEIARDLQTREEPSHSPLSPLPAEQWVIEDGDMPVSVELVESVSLQT